jgi:GNAT superfamily N-acetyltransferase
MILPGQMNLALIKLTPEQAGQLSELACAIYRENYGYLWKTGGADWYMHHHAYRQEKLATEISSADTATYFLLSNKQVMGYLKLIWRYDEEASARVMEIERIYLLQAAKGKGYGRFLMQFAEEQACDNGTDILRLKAMDSSQDALSFYQHHGYRHAGTYHLDFPLMKPEYRGMIILEKRVSKKNPPASGGKSGF